MGGAVEELTGNYGPGFTGRRLIDGLAAPTWKLEGLPARTRAAGLDAGPYPQEIVFSLAIRLGVEDDQFVIRR